MRSKQFNLILAGGLGSRLKSAVSDRPKPLADINGRPYFSIINFWISQGYHSFILLTGYKHHQISKYFKEIIMMGTTFFCRGQSTRHRWSAHQSNK